MMRIFFFLLAGCSLYGKSHLEQIFTEIYAMGTWDESGFSLSGSQLEVSQEYVRFLQNFLKKNQIRSVVDIGCGDWAFSRYIDWSGIHYIGVDIVKSIVERNQALFTTPWIEFLHADALEIELPEADLVICKDVFQHLSNADVKKLLEKFCKFQHCLITDYVDPQTVSSNNIDITSGHYRPIDLTKPPFHVQGKKVLLFQSIGAPKQTLHIQQEELSSASMR